MDDPLSITNLFRRITGKVNPSGGGDDNKMTFNSSASVVASNIDILTLILLWLPVKSLLVFKLVSKQWFSLITDLNFTRMYTIRSCRRPIPGLFIQSEFPQFLVLDKSNINVKHVKTRLINVVNDISIDIKNNRTQILHSCNGLILCHSGRDTYRVYNPTTGHSKTLPIPSSFYNLRRASSFYHNFSLAFDPMKSSYYEVIYVQEASPFEVFSHDVEIYSSKTDSWKILEGFQVENSGPLISSGVFWNGSLHWMPYGNQLTYFDIDGELLKTMSMPPSAEGMRDEIEYFGECKGHLYIIHKADHRAGEFDIFEMETDYSGWIKRYHVNLNELAIDLLDEEDLKRWSDELFGIDERVMLDFNVLLVEENEADSFKLVLRVERKYISYDTKHQSFKIIFGVSPSLLTNRPRTTREVLRPRRSLLCSKLNVYQCIDSLASV
ncbi:hypothetical protein C5167_029565 [Papaver somniferum]|uniref:F-box protein At5g07610-like n=1 Tax=Papaver somniferum TaxID=3469 RepID=UPI000E6F6AFE|nr:F-box protein At5g07610-like [Papaver somniferum]RZC90432.1 hypothetical protein C5167_029565 [Papaver somniferum]